MTTPISVTYRGATPLDHCVVVQLLGELVDELGAGNSQKEIKSMLDDDIALALSSADIHIILAEIDGEIIGLGRGDILTTDPIFRLRKDHRCGYVDQMFVLPIYRGQQIGAELLSQLEAWFREKGVRHSLLHAAPKAVRFYAQKGYQPNREMFKRL